MRTARLDSALTALREAGARVTTARRAVLAALVGAPDHLTADDVAEEVRRLHPDVHRSTIYRTLDALERLGVVEHAHLGHGRAVFHLAVDAHHHLVCEECDAVVEVTDESFAALATSLRDAYGFELRAHHFALPGRCRRCTGAAG